jgi:hypothetical protein
MYKMPFASWQQRCQPAFGFSERHAAALRPVLQLVAADFAYRKILRLGVRQIKAGD